MEFTRLRHSRKNPGIRDLLAETRICPKDLVLPYFVVEGKNKKEPLVSLPGIYRLSIDNLIRDISQVRSLGIKGVLLFGLSSKKDSLGTAAYSARGVVQRAIKAIKREIKDLVVITDVCLCGYTSHGHCGIVENHEIDNDKTLKVLANIALSHSRVGADFVAPSAMMDGQVRVIRSALDKNGFKDTGIFSYSAKYASNFYWPFREALDSSPKFGDRKTYQMDIRNSDEAMREIEEDIKEGADIVMVKPALAYLDIIRKTRDKFNVPLAAYNVSGEYALIKAAARESLFDEQKVVFEILTAIKRAGANIIITYHAKEVAQWLRD